MHIGTGANDKVNLPIVWPPPKHAKLDNSKYLLAWKPLWWLWIDSTFHQRTSVVFDFWVNGLTSSASIQIKISDVLTMQESSPLLTKRAPQLTRQSSLTSWELHWNRQGITPMTSSFSSPWQYWVVKLHGFASCYLNSALIRNWKNWMEAVGKLKN